MVVIANDLSEYDFRYFRKSISIKDGDVSNRGQNQISNRVKQGRPCSG